MSHHLYNRHFVESKAMDKNFGSITAIVSIEIYTNRKQNVKLELINPPENIKQCLDFKFPHFNPVAFYLYVYFLKLIFFVLWSLAEKPEPCPFKIQNLNRRVLDFKKLPIALLLKSLIRKHCRNMPRSIKKILLEKRHPFLILNGLDYFPIKEIILKMKYLNFLTQ